MPPRYTGYSTMFYLLYQEKKKHNSQSYILTFKKKGLGIFDGAFPSKDSYKEEWHSPSTKSGGSSVSTCYQSSKTLL